mmetsp:Transcript_12784/g.34619  ORF Transcript_12784/g.34619 Transcript_12784/m.34619 type:complete len:407 (+) Transcript_12784:554-1774(+)
MLGLGGVACSRTSFDGLVVACQVRLELRGLGPEEPAPRALDVASLCASTDDSAECRNIRLYVRNVLHHLHDVLASIHIAGLGGRHEPDVEALGIRVEALILHDLHPGLHARDVSALRVRHHHGVEVILAQLLSLFLHRLHPIHSRYWVLSLRGHLHEQQVRLGVWLHAKFLHLLQHLVCAVIQTTACVELQQTVVGLDANATKARFPHLREGRLGTRQVVGLRVGIDQYAVADGIRLHPTASHSAHPILHLVVIPRLGPTTQQRVEGDDVGLEHAIQHVHHPTLCCFRPASLGVRLHHEVEEDPAHGQAHDLLPPDGDHHASCNRPISKFGRLRHDDHAILQRQPHLLVGHATLVEVLPGRRTSDLLEEGDLGPHVLALRVEPNGAFGHRRDGDLQVQLGQELVHL